MVKTVRYILVFIFMTFLLLAFNPFVFAAPSVKLVINGSEVNPKVPPVIHDNTTLVPIRVVSETLGAYVFWNDATRQVEITYGGSDIILPIGKKEALVDGVKVKLQVPAKIIQDTTMVPLRFVAESMGALVEWMEDSRTVAVESKSHELTGVEYNETQDGGHIEISFSGAVKYESFFLDNSNRLVIDVQRTVLKTPHRMISVNKNGIEQVRVGQFQVDPDISRIVIDLAGRLPYEVTAGENGKKLFISVKNRVDGVEYKKDGEEAWAVIKTVGPPVFTVEELDNPNRLVFDVHNAIINSGAQRVVEIDDKKLYRIRMAQFSSKPDIVRVVFDLKDKPSYSAMVDETGSLKVLFSDMALFKRVSHKSLDGKTLVLLEFSRVVDFTAENKNGTLTVTVPNAELQTSRQKPHIIEDGIVNAVTVTEEKRSGKKCVVFGFELPYYFRHVASEPPSKTIELEFYESPLKDKLIVIDPGHGGDSPGAIGSSGVQEKDLALDISRRLNGLLQKSGAKTYMIRDSDISVPYQIRPNIANEMNADLFVSIHINAYTNSKINGVETLYCPSDTKDNARLAQAVHSAMLESLDLADRGIWKRTDLVVLRETAMPAVMSEVGYITNPEDEKKLLDPDFRQQAAQALYNGIIKYYSGL